MSPVVSERPNPFLRKMAGMLENAAVRLGDAAWQDVAGQRHAAAELSEKLMWAGNTLHAFARLAVFPAECAAAVDEEPVPKRLTARRVLAAVLIAALAGSAPLFGLIHAFSLPPLPVLLSFWLGCVWLALLNWALEKLDLV